MSKPPKAKSAIPSKLTAPKSVNAIASGQRITRPTAEIKRLTLNGFDFFECLPTMTTEKPEAAAESSARATPIVALQEVLLGIKANLLSYDSANGF